MCVWNQCTPIDPDKPTQRLLRIAPGVRSPNVHKRRPYKVLTLDDPAVRKQMLPLLPITLLGVAVDLWLRPTLDLRLTQWAWWGLSVAFSLVMWQGLFALSSRLRPRWQTAFVGGIGGVAAVLTVGWLGFHEVFYCWPTAYALVHSAGHPREAWGYIYNEADWGGRGRLGGGGGFCGGLVALQAALGPPARARQNVGRAGLGRGGGFWRGASPREHHGAGCGGRETGC